MKIPNPLLEIYKDLREHGDYRRIAIGELHCQSEIDIRRKSALIREAFRNGGASDEILNAMQKYYEEKNKRMNQFIKKFNSIKTKDKLRVMSQTATAL